ncbi:hypothetical protein XELAEV_18025254mg [Xenopus laevis]|uniref:Uncharacterized protein n=1 Tax=Xenopus laevis TaxID=8355 RepID=A0A974CZC9_XENLA|nr:hypothetical protein XELAEV_18025254mg [Xenopus laevis]
MIWLPKLYVLRTIPITIPSTFFVKLTNTRNKSTAGVGMPNTKKYYIANIINQVTILLSLQPQTKWCDIEMPLLESASLEFIFWTMEKCNKGKTINLPVTLKTAINIWRGY